MDSKTIEAREAVSKLKALKLDWRNHKISAASAEAMGKYYVDAYNAHAKAIAKKYKTNPKLMGYKITDYPNEGLW